MKKIFSLAAVVLVAGSLNAQNLSFGPTVGFGHSLLSSSEDLSNGYERKFRSAYNAGVKLVYSFVSDWGVSADVKFSGEGGKFQSDAAGSRETIYRANYIRVPVQAIYFFEQLGDRVRPKVSLGPSVGFVVGGQLKTKEDGEETNKSDIDNYIKGFDFGLNGAIGANIRMMGNKWINADITYYHGLINVSEASGGDLKNRGIGINVGILFPIGTVKASK